MIQINLDVKMPESCADCLLEGDWDSCPLLCEDTHLFKNKRHPDCPLVEVVKCEDCEYYKAKQESLLWNNSRMYCNRSVILCTKPNDWCSRGIRREK